MPSVALSDITADELLTEMAVGFEQDAEGFLHNKVFAVLPVEEKTGHYYVHNKSDQFRVETAQRAPGGEAAEKTWGIAERTFSATPYSLKAKLPDEHRATKNSPVDDEVMVSGLVHDQMMRRELLFHANFLGTGIWTTDKNGATADFTQWNAVGATVVQNVLDWQTLVKLSCGSRPNVGVMTYDVFAHLKTNSEVLERVKYTSDDSIAIDTLKRYFELEELYVGDAIYNAAKEGAADAMQAMATGVFALFFVDRRQSKRTKTAGRVISWTEFDNVREMMTEGGGTTAVRTWREEKIRSDWFQADAYYGMHKVSADCGLYAYNVLS